MRRVVDSPRVLALGHTVIATPTVIVIVMAALRVSDPAMELAACSLGANYWRALWFVTIPSIRPALVAGAAFAFLISFDDVVIAIFLGGPDATTLPKRMWETIRFEIDPTLTAISLAPNTYCDPDSFRHRTRPPQRSTGVISARKNSSRFSHRTGWRNCKHGGALRRRGERNKGETGFGKGGCGGRI